MLDSSMHVESFPPVIGQAPRVLILGSMPGRASLAAAQYYAHPRNAFWRILDRLGILDATLPYAERLAALTAARIALWDVLAMCDRSGSLDVAIVAQSEVPNDVAGLLRCQPTIERILFNGMKAETAFRSHILRHLGECAAARLEYVRLPSTSPARAIPFDVKLEAWREALRTSPRTRQAIVRR